MFTFFGLVVLITASVAGGWWLCRKFGAKAAADLQAVKDTAAKL